MPTYNLSNMADKEKYAEQMGLNTSKVEMPAEVQAEYDRIKADPSTDSEFARNDYQNIVSRRDVANETYDVGNDSQTTTDAGAQTQQTPTQPTTDTNTTT